jgi:alkylation response protein AidB-like acyl-CoA dehydrogenase
MAPSGEAFRDHVRAILAEELPSGWRGLGAIEDRGEAEAFVESWRATMLRRGLLGLQWPVEYGGQGLTKLEQVILVEEFAKAGVPSMGVSDTFGLKMIGNTLLQWGTEEQKRRFLPAILSGEIRWCQGFSEPSSGSDLASLATRAELAGDSWVINGQKLWTSRAREANWIFLLARTDPDAPKNRGITFLVIDMDQPGIEIRPIRAMSGDSEFNEVFLTDVTTPVDHVVGEVNGGWAVAMTLLGLERGEEAATNPILFRAELDRLFAMAVERGASKDPVIRQRLAALFIRVEIMRYLGDKILAGVLASDGRLGPESSISKLFWSEYHKDVANLALDVMGPAGQIVDGRGLLRAFRYDDPGAPNSSGRWIGTLYNATAGTIYAGTSQIQRNILSETVLGLPREPR